MLPIYYFIINKKKKILLNDIAYQQRSFISYIHSPFKRFVYISIVVMTTNISFFTGTVFFFVLDTELFTFFFPQNNIEKRNKILCHFDIEMIDRPKDRPREKIMTLISSFTSIWCHYAQSPQNETTMTERCGTCHAFHHHREHHYH